MPRAPRTKAGRAQLRAEHDEKYQSPDVVHDPGHDAALERESRIPIEVRERIAAGIDLAGGGRILVGTASWTDPTLTESEVFYPRDVRTPEQRLRFYSAHFPLVEVDSSYYALPTEQMAVAWATRTPPHFTFDVKAHAWMTGQPSEPSRLPKDLKEALPAELREKRTVYPADLPAEIRDEVWARFLAALAPLRAAGKLGSILLQYPRWFLPNKESAAIIDDARERLGDVAGAVELRNHRWFASESRTKRVLDFLRDRGLAFVMVDGPPGLESSVPRVVAATSPDVAVVRMHGRRADLWERRGVPTVERYRYLYDDQQLDEWTAPIIDVAKETKRVHVLMNNCHGNYGTTNAAEIGAMMIERDDAQGRGRVVAM